jgi:hypothetical protein
LNRLPQPSGTRQARLHASNRKLAMGVTLFGVLSLAIGGLSVPTVATPVTPDQPISAIPELIGQRYCYGDAELFSVWLKLRMRYKNRTDKTLILDKEIGKAWYGVTVARNAEDLASGKYEYNPNIDWVFTDKDELPSTPSATSPGPNFAISAPGQTFESEINSSVIAQYENPKGFAGSIRSGVHILQMELSSWSHPGVASEFERRWRKVGQLVTGVIKTEPLEIRVPSDPKVEKDCK